MAVYAHRGERTEPQYNILGTSRTSRTDPPRWTYSKPTVKSQPGLPTELGTDIESYKLPVVDVDTSRRNYPGYDKQEVYTMEDIQQGDISGTTETDSSTHPQGSGGYTKINQKMGKRQHVPIKRS